jgi:WD40 repeat protein
MMWQKSFWVSQLIFLGTLGHTDTAKGVIALAGDCLVSWSDDGNLRLWSTEGSLETVVEGHSISIKGMLLLPDGRIVSWSHDHILRLWSPDGASSIVLVGHAGAVNGAEVLLNGRLLLVTG